MSVKEFLEQSGCKVLALAKLSECEYSVVLYLLNSAISGLTDVITTEAEIAGILQFDISMIRSALSNLSERELIKLHYGDLSQKPKIQSLRIGINLNFEQWKLSFDKNSSDDSQAAIIFPFRRGGQFTVLQGSRGRQSKKTETETWQRVMASFEKGRELTHDERRRSQSIAQTLVETHPVDQILLLIRHFGHRIPTLSLLASSWNHFASAYEEETQKVNMLEARKKHFELEQQLRDYARSYFDDRHETKLSDDEIAVLEVLLTHRYP